MGGQYGPNCIAETRREPLGTGSQSATTTCPLPDVRHLNNTAFHAWKGVICCFARQHLRRSAAAKLYAAGRRPSTGTVATHIYMSCAAVVHRTFAECVRRIHVSRLHASASSAVFQHHAGDGKTAGLVFDLVGPEPEVRAHRFQPFGLLCLAHRSLYASAEGEQI